jgi:hypothetical protein
MGVQGSRGPLGEGGVSKETEDIAHVGYQFYSDFRTEKEYTINTSLQFLWSPKPPYATQWPDLKF